MRVYSIILNNFVCSFVVVLYLCYVASDNLHCLNDTCRSISIDSSFLFFFFIIGMMFSMRGIWCNKMNTHTHTHTKFFHYSNMECHLDILNSNAKIRSKHGRGRWTWVHCVYSIIFYHYHYYYFFFLCIPFRQNSIWVPVCDKIIRIKFWSRENML